MQNIRILRRRQDSSDRPLESTGGHWQCSKYTLTIGCPVQWLPRCQLPHYWHTACSTAAKLYTSQVPEATPPAPSDLVVGLEVVYLLVEGQHPQLLADEHHRVQLVLEARGVPRGSLHQTLPNAVAQAFQLLQYLTLRVGGRCVRTSQEA